jgi:hypothetical protein
MTYPSVPEIFISPPVPSIDVSAPVPAIQVTDCSSSIETGVPSIQITDCSNSPKTLPSGTQIFPPKYTPEAECPTCLTLSSQLLALWQGFTPFSHSTSSLLKNSIHQHLRDHSPSVLMVEKLMHTGMDMPIPRGDFAMDVERSDGSIPEGMRKWDLGERKAIRRRHTPVRNCSELDPYDNPTEETGSEGSESTCSRTDVERGLESETPGEARKAPFAYLRRREMVNEDAVSKWALRKWRIFQWTKVVEAGLVEEIVHFPTEYA